MYFDVYLDVLKGKNNIKHLIDWWKSQISAKILVKKFEKKIENFHHRHVGKKLEILIEIGDKNINCVRKTDN